MAAGVHQDRGLTRLMLSMVDQTDVGTAKEDHGQTMFTECQVCVKETLNVFKTALFREFSSPNNREMSENPMT